MPASPKNSRWSAPCALRNTLVLRAERPQGPLKSRRIPGPVVSLLVALAMAGAALVFAAPPPPSSGYWIVNDWSSTGTG